MCRLYAVQHSIRMVLASRLARTRRFVSTTSTGTSSSYTTASMSRII
jgi:hypothetical protein